MVVVSLFFAMEISCGWMPQRENYRRWSIRKIGNNRTPAQADLSGNQFGMGVELLGAFRANVSAADCGASVL